MSQEGTEAKKIASDQAEGDYDKGCQQDDEG